MFEEDEDRWSLDVTLPVRRFMFILEICWLTYIEC
jgi:hypothetical protein